MGPGSAHGTGMCKASVHSTALEDGKKKERWGERQRKLTRKTGRGPVLTETKVGMLGYGSVVKSTWSAHTW